MSRTVIRNSRERTPSLVPAATAAACFASCNAVSPVPARVSVKLVVRSMLTTLSGTSTTASLFSGSNNSNTVPASTPATEARRMCVGFTIAASWVRETNPGASSSTEIRRRLPHVPASMASTSINGERATTTEPAACARSSAAVKGAGMLSPISAG